MGSLCMAYTIQFIEDILGPPLLANIRGPDIMTISENLTMIGVVSNAYEEIECRRKLSN
jgi:hypothetical protein